MAHSVLAPPPSGPPEARPRVLTPKGATAIAATTSEAQHGHCLLRAVSPSLLPRAATDFTACGAVAIKVNVREVQADGAAELTLSAGVDEEHHRDSKRPRLSPMGTSMNPAGFDCTLGCGQWWTKMELPVVPRGIDPTPPRGIGVAAVVAPLDQHGRVLLTRRPRHMRTFPGCWVLPGGSVDAGESTLSAALRELQEETGLRPDRLPSQPFAMWEVWRALASVKALRTLTLQKLLSCGRRLHNMRCLRALAEQLPLPGRTMVFSCA